MKARNHSLDNLKSFLIFCVVIVHCGLVYEEVLVESWITSDPDKSGGIGLVRMYIDAFVMYLWFFIGGYFVTSSKANRSFPEFLGTKFYRLILPWLFGVAILIPIYKWIFLHSRGLPQEPWYTYFHFFQRDGGSPYFFADNPVQNWLWFLPVLFLFQMIYVVIPKSIFLRISFKRAVLLTVILGSLYGWAVSSLVGTGWYHSFLFHFQKERILTYFLVFLLGSFAYRQSTLMTLHKNKKLYFWVNGILAVSMTVFTIVALNLFFNMVDPNRNFYFVNLSADRLLYYFSQIVTMISISYLLLYTFQKYFNGSGKLAQIMARSSYDVYIIHVVILGIISLFLMPFSMSPWIKMLALSFLTFGFSILISFLYQNSIGKWVSHSPTQTGLTLAFIILLIAAWVSK